MCNELQALGQDGNELLVNQSRNGHACESPVCSDNLIKCSHPGLLDKFLPGSSFGFDEIGD